MFRINYVLKTPGQIAAWGEKRKYLHWFGLTDGLLWIEAGNSVIYKYADRHEGEGGIPVRYNDYQLSRFAEDLLALTPFISESVPEELYDAAQEMERDLRKWSLSYSDLGDEEYDRFFDEEYALLGGWFRERCMDSGHLREGPLIGYIRCGDRIKILWDTAAAEEESGSLWKYPSGVYEMEYSDFVREVTRFVNAFLSDMDAQVFDVAGRGIPGVFVDTGTLIRENSRRREIFGRQLKDLYGEDKDRTDWKRIRELYERMRREIRIRKE